MEFIMGYITMFSGNFAPKDWASCEGQLLAISQNQALYAIVGTSFGGDGRTTFALPDLRSRVPVGIGRGPGLSTVNLGRQVGSETTTMTVAQMPSHAHSASFAGSGGGSGGSLTASAKMFTAGSSGDTNEPANAYCAAGKSGLNNLNVYSTTKGTDTIAADAIEVTLSGSAGGITGGTVTVDANGGSKAQNNIQPSLGMRYLICTIGTFPSRN